MGNNECDHEWVQDSWVSLGNFTHTHERLVCDTQTIVQRCAHCGGVRTIHEDNRGASPLINIVEQLAR